MMTVTTLREYQHKCELRVEECFKIAEKEYQRDIPRPRITWSTQQKRCAGTARTDIFGNPVEIKLSLSVLSLNGDDFLARTPGHEAAHCIADHVFGRSGHGPAWCRVMRLLGQPADRYHNMATERTVTGVPFVCDCDTHMLTKQRAAKVFRGAVLICRKCRTRLKQKIVDQDIREVANAKAASHKAVIKQAAKITKTPITKVKTKVAKTPKATDGRKRIAGQKTFADKMRELILANKGKSYEEMILLAVKIEPNKGKCRSYVRHIMKNEMGLKI